MSGTDRILLAILGLAVGLNESFTGIAGVERPVP